MKELLDIQNELLASSEKKHFKLGLRRFRYPVDIMPKHLAEKLSAEVQLELNIETQISDIAERSKKLFKKINNLIPDELEIDLWLNSKDVGIQICYQEQGCYTPVNFSPQSGSSIITQLENFDWPTSFGQSLELSQSLNDQLFEQYTNQKPIDFCNSKIRNHMPKMIYRDLCSKLRSLLKDKNATYGAVFLNASYLNGNKDSPPPKLEAYNTKFELVRVIPDFLAMSHQPFILMFNGNILGDKLVDRKKQQALSKLKSKSISYLNATYQTQ